MPRPFPIAAAFILTAAGAVAQDRSNGLPLGEMQDLTCSAFLDMSLVDQEAAAVALQMAALNTMETGGSGTPDMGGAAGNTDSGGGTEDTGATSSSDSAGSGSAGADAASSNNDQSGDSRQGASNDSSPMVIALTTICENTVSAEDPGN